MMKTLVNVKKDDLKKYVEHEFKVDSSIDKVKINYAYDKLGGENVVDFALKSGTKFLGATGGAYSEIILSNDNSTSPGYPIELRDNYTIVFRIYKVLEDFDIELDIEFVEKQKQIYIADLHTHTYCSDGGFSIADVDKFAINKKIDIIGITDHFAMNANRYLSNEFKTQMLLGFELTMQWGHMGIYGLPADKVEYQFNSKEEVSSWLEKIKEEHDVIRIINHPYGNCEDCEWKLGYAYEILELFNSFDITNNIKTLELYQGLLEEGNYIPVMCGSDTHKQRWHSDKVSTHGLPANKVYAINKSEREIFDAIRSYDNECSYYPQLDTKISLDDDGRIAYENLPSKSTVKAFTEKGEVNINKEVIYEKFIRFEVWQDTNEFQIYLQNQIGTKLEFDYEQVPIFASNPIFLGE